jgi:hypothetical protein
MKKNRKTARTRRSSCSKPGRKATRRRSSGGTHKPYRSRSSALVASGSNTEPLPTKCRPLNSDGSKSCCLYPGSTKWYPYDPETGWDLTTECDGGARPQ